MASSLWATRLAPEGIRVYEIRPGIIRTDMTAGVAEKYATGQVPAIDRGLTIPRL
jgi:NAD(P)-dependent dehydrogenase (short-subunit alcohol dehydrogenase family)